MTSKRKNILRIFGLTILIFFIFTNFSAFAQDYASVIKDGVNIRSGPSTKNEVLWEVFKGFPVEILKKEGDWSQIKDFENDKGWIYSSLLSSKKTVIVKGETVNMRSGPSKGDKIIATVKKGVVFKPVEQRGGWIKVHYKNDISGWIFNTLLFPNKI